MTKIRSAHRKLEAEDLIALIGETDALANLPIIFTSPLLVNTDLYDHWFMAMDSVEKRNDGEDLARLVETCEMPPAVRLALGDLIRRKFNPNRGKRAKPMYDLPAKAKTLLIAARVYEDLRHHSKLERRHALAEAAKRHGLSEQLLDDHIAGKLGCTQRVIRERQAFLAALTSQVGSKT